MPATENGGLENDGLVLWERPHAKQTCYFPSRIVNGRSTPYIYRTAVITDKYRVAVGFDNNILAAL